MTITKAIKLKYAQWATSNVPDDECMCGSEIRENRYCDNHSPLSVRDCSIRKIMETPIPAIAYIILVASLIGLAIIDYFVFR